MRGDEDPLTETAARVLAARPTASMEDIARAAGISRATLFRRFPSRGALVETLCRHAVAGFDAATSASAVPVGRSPESRLRDLVEHLVPVATRYGVLATQALPEDLERELLAGVAVAEARVRDLVRDGQRAGVFRPDVDPEWVLVVLIWTAIGAADATRLGRLAPAHVAHDLTDTVLRLLRDDR